MAHANSELPSDADSAQSCSHTESAIEAVLGKTEQTYEEFMSCFIGLKKEDVVPFHVRRMEDMFINRADDKDPGRSQRSEVDPDQVKDDTQAHNVKSSSGQEGIDTEELDEGTFVPARQTANLPLGNRFVKMDNFVDDADLIDDVPEGNYEFEDITSQPYETSIGSTESPRLRPEEGPAARISMVEEKKAAGHGIRGDAQTRTLSEQDEMELDDPCSEITDNSAVAPLKLSQDLLRRSREDDGSGEEEEEVSGDSSELRKSFEMKTLPGEAEEESDDASSALLLEHGVHHTELKMSSTRVQEAGGQRSETGAVTEESNSDDIQPFSLDADFDYDNVTLTPKWDLNQQPFGGNYNQH